MKQRPCVNAVMAAVLQQVEATLGTANTEELAAFLCTYAANCPLGNDQEAGRAHALLIKSLDQQLPALLKILASNADLNRDYLLTLLRIPATQPLPQRNILLQLRKAPPTTAIGRQVLEALEESVEQGDAALQNVYNDKSHTYQ